MISHPAHDDLLATPLRPDVRRHLDQCVRCRMDQKRLALLETSVPVVEVLPFEERYRTGDRVGRGPRSEARLAFDMVLERTVLLKQLSGPVDPESLRTVQAALDHLAHPHVARILDVPHTESPAYTRLHIEGRDLSEFPSAPAPLRHAWFCQLAASVASLHQAHLVHGALRPSNVRVSPRGQIHLVDAGLGAPLTGPERAPELDGPLDRSYAADWYAVGVLFANGPLPALTARMRAENPDDRPTATDVLAALLIERDPAMEGHGRYRRLATLGRGGMGEVLRVRDPVLQRVVALKSMLPQLLDSADANQRFRTEAQITAQLEHPGVIPVHDMGDLADGSPYFTMKQVAGNTLAVVLQQAADDPEWTTAQGVEILLRASEAVAYAHSRGVVHRDLKPANLMVGDFGEVLVLDWGLAKLVEAGEDPIESQVPSRPGDSRPGLGTPGYMALEQLTGEGAIGPHTDVFALGAILEEVLATSTPVPALAAVAAKARRPDPADRYPDAAAFGRELVRWRTGEPVQAYAYSPVERLGRRLRPYQAPLLVAAVASAVVAVVGAVGTVQVATHQRLAKENLAQSLVERAQLALLANDRIPAEGYAAGAVALSNRPEARGVLARLGRLPYPALVATTPHSCHSLAAAGEWAACELDDSVLGWSSAGDTWTADRGRVWTGRPGTLLIEQPGRVRMVDARDGRLVKEWAQDSPLVGTAALGDELVLATATGVRTLDGATDEERLPRADVVELIGCGPTSVVIRTEAKALFRWAPGGEAEVLSVSGQQAGALTCDPSGVKLAVGAGSGIRIWSLEPTVQLANLAGHEGPVTRLDWSGALASTSKDGTARLWNPTDGAELARIPAPDATGLKFHGDRLWLASDHGLQLWQLPQAQQIGSFDAFVDLLAVDWTPSNHLITVDQGGDWRRNSPTTGTSDAMIRVRGIPAAAIATAPDGDRVAVGLADGRVVLLDEDAAWLWALEAVAGVATTALSWSHTGDPIVVGSADGSVRELAPDGTKRSTWSEATGDPVDAIVLSGDGHVALVHRKSGASQRFRDGRPVAQALPTSRLLATDRTGGTTAYVGADGSVVVLRGTTRQPVGAQEVQALALSSDGAWLATASRRLVQVWSTADGSEAARLVAHARGAADLAFSPDDRTLVTAGRDGEVILWDTEPIRLPASALVARVTDHYGEHATHTLSGPGAL